HQVLILLDEDVQPQQWQLLHCWQFPRPRNPFLTQAAYGNPRVPEFGHQLSVRECAGSWLLSSSFSSKVTTSEISMGVGIEGTHTLIVTRYPVDSAGPYVT